jgi:hypothetical protein
MQQDDRQENEDQTVLPIEMNERIYVIRKDDIQCSTLSICVLLMIVAR